MFSHICQLVEGLPASAIINCLYGNRKLYCITFRNPNALKYRKQRNTESLYF